MPAWVQVALKIAIAAAPLVEKLSKLIGLFGKTQAEGLSVQQVEEEIEKILKDSTSMDEIENKLAGIP